VVLPSILRLDGSRELTIRAPGPSARQVCEEWFTRGRELLVRIASMASAHHHAAHHGLLRLRDMRGAMRQLLVGLAKERGKAAAAASAKAGGTGASTGDPKGPAGIPAAGASAAATNSIAAQQSGPAAARQGGKQLQRRGAAGGGAAAGQNQQSQQQAAGTAAAAAAPAAAAAGSGLASTGGDEVAASEAGAAAPSAVQQLESSVSRLGLAVVDLLKLVGGALLAMDDTESLQVSCRPWAPRWSLYPVHYVSKSKRFHLPYRRVLGFSLRSYGPCSRKSG
jgi:PI-3-kinase-related kinase SMG-1